MIDHVPTWRCKQFVHQRTLKIVTDTLPDSIITHQVVHWCRLEAPKKVIVSIILYHFSCHFLFCLACSITTKMPCVFRQGDLPKLDIQVDRGSDFMAWTAEWESYMSLSGLSKESNEKKVQVLILCFTSETLSIVHILGLSDAEKKDAGAIIATIKKYIDGHINELVERRHFRRCTQQHGECFDNFLLALHDLRYSSSLTLHSHVKTCVRSPDFCVELLNISRVFDIYSQFWHAHACIFFEKSTCVHQHTLHEYTQNCTSTLTR